MRLRAMLGYFALGLMVASGVIASLGLVQLMRQFPAAASSPRLLAPFLQPVLALALEAGALVALSFALLRALSASPAAPALSRLRSTSTLLGLLGCSAALAQLIPRGTEHPGAFANQLVRSARQSCVARERVPVPLLGLSVSCAPPQRIEGPMPGAKTVQLAMAELTFSDDLRRVEMKELELSAASALRVHLRAKSARVSGLAPWSRSARLSPLGRWTLLALLGAVLWLGAGWLWARANARRAGVAPASERASRWLGGLLFAAPGAAAALVVIWLDQAQAAPPTYALAAVVELGGLGLAAALAARFPRITKYYASF